MTIAERNNKLKHFITCLKCEVSGKCCDDNCSTQYEAGNMGEIIENLEAISKVLEQEPFINKPCVSTEICEHDKQKVLNKIRTEIIEKYWDCDICKWKIDYKPHYAIRGDINDILQILDKYKAETEE